MNFFTYQKNVSSGSKLEKEQVQTLDKEANLIISIMHFSKKLNHQLRKKRRGMTWANDSHRKISLVARGADLSCYQQAFLEIFSPTISNNVFNMKRKQSKGREMTSQGK